MEQNELFEAVDNESNYDLDSNETTEDNIAKEADFIGLGISPSDWTVGTIYSQIGKQIDLDPTFQRRSVWKAKAKSQFIESLFLGIPIPQILLAARVGQKNSFLVLDGKQRLTTIKEFIDGHFANGEPFKLTNIKVLKEILDGKTWLEIRDNTEIADRLLNETLRTTVLRGWNNETVLYDIFFRLNSSSVGLSPMELRMSLHPGAFLKYSVKWTENVGPVHKLLNKKSPDPRMLDVELAVRHSAFLNESIEYSGNLKSFLDESCKNYNELMKTENGQSEVEAIFLNLNKGIEAGIDIFGENICRKYLTTKKYENRFNRALFDVVIGSLANQGFRNWAIENKQTVVQEYEQLFLTDVEFVRSIETTTKTPQAVMKRFRTWYGIASRISGINIKIPRIFQKRDEANNAELN